MTLMKIKKMFSSSSSSSLVILLIMQSTTLCYAEHNFSMSISASGVVNSKASIQKQNLTKNSITTKISANSISISKYEGSYANIKWNRGNLEKCIVFISEGTEGCVPQNNLSYIASTTFGQGTNAVNGYYCIYNGVGDSVKVTGLIGLRNYTVQVFEYDGSVGNENYLTTNLTNNSINFTTLPFTKQSDFSVSGFSSENSYNLGDYDNDGYLDILRTYLYQWDVSYEGNTEIYRNNGDKSFKKTNIALTGIYSGTATWGDINNDGNLDILESGLYTAYSWKFRADTTKLYKNLGDGTFIQQNDILSQGLYGSSICWGDYNNDGYLDILLTGHKDTYGYQGPDMSKLYRNNGDNTFTEETGIQLAGITNGSTAWGDYDNDGDLDIILTGSGISKIYRNNGDNTFTEQTGISLPGLSYSSIAWGDYDNDGFLDLLITGTTNNINISKIYRNNGNNSFSEQTDILLDGVWNGSAIWGDYDNDGFLDILLSGNKGTSSISNNIAKIYRNNGNNTFTEQTSISLPGVTGKCIAWGDLDNDKDLDFIIGGKIYINDMKIAKAIPNNAPTDLTHTVTQNNVILNWNPSSQTPPVHGVSYNISVYSKTDSKTTLQSNSANNGFRKVATIGNAQLNTSYTLKGLRIGTYYWQVQSLDNRFQGGAFSAIDTFAVVDTLVVKIPIQSSGLSISNIVSNKALLKWKRGNLSKCVVFIKEGSGTCIPANNKIYLASHIYKNGVVF